MCVCLAGRSATTLSGTRNMRQGGGDGGGDGWCLIDVLKYAYNVCGVLSAMSSRKCQQGKGRRRWRMAVELPGKVSRCCRFMLRGVVCINKVSTALATARPHVWILFGINSRHIAGDDDDDDDDGNNYTSEASAVADAASESSRGLKIVESGSAER